jgi:hypothetical protein
LDALEALTLELVKTAQKQNYADEVIGVLGHSLRVCVKGLEKKYLD